MDKEYYNIDYAELGTPVKMNNDTKHPYCNCKKGTLDEDVLVLPSLQLTECSDNETCNYCGYYAIFMTKEERKNMSKRTNNG